MTTALWVALTLKLAKLLTKSRFKYQRYTTAADLSWTRTGFWQQLTASQGILICKWCVWQPFLTPKSIMFAGRTSGIIQYLPELTTWLLAVLNMRSIRLSTTHPSTNRTKQMILLWSECGHRLSSMISSNRLNTILTQSVETKICCWVRFLILAWILEISS